MIADKETFLEFQQVKNTITVRSKLLNSREDLLRLLQKVENTDAFLEFFKLHCYSLLESQFLTTSELIEWFGSDCLNRAHIYTSGHHNITLNKQEKLSILTLANSQATVETRENSQATVETWENSQATVETRENSQATVETRENSQATVETRENSQATVKTWENSQATTSCIGGFIRDVSKKKIFYKKSDYEIVLIN
jgi:hypothetical protein